MRSSESCHILESGFTAFGEQKKRFPFLTADNTKAILVHIKENAESKGIYIDFINAHRDHVHCLISLNPGQTIDKIMQLLKGESSHWINKQQMTQSAFEWADEYFAIFVSDTQVTSRKRVYQKSGKASSYENVGTGILRIY
ncbi:transposase [Candidatus Moduliflexus flocculans]|uniref:Transposase n=1 Tax=Candidatus Moduliflexus flocculans TaxID=1499966 RepID=A0A081BR88_9BACT|nr:transposase [Candidatus Moduliflexus flocculans]